MQAAILVDGEVVRQDSSDAFRHAITHGCELKSGMRPRAFVEGQRRSGRRAGGLGREIVLRPRGLECVLRCCQLDLHLMEADGHQWESGGVRVSPASTLPPTLDAPATTTRASGTQGRRKD